MFGIKMRLVFWLNLARMENVCTNRFVSIRKERLPAYSNPLETGFVGNGAMIVERKNSDMIEYGLRRAAFIRVAFSLVTTVKKEAVF